MFHHPNPESIDRNKFTQIWSDAVNIIKAIGYTYNTKKLKKISLDPKHQLVLKSLYTFLGNLQQNQDKQENDVQQLQTQQGEDASTINQLKKQQDEISSVIDQLSKQLDIVAKEVKYHQQLLSSAKIEGISLSLIHI